MARFRITYIVEIDDDDPSLVLDGAHAATGDLAGHLAAECRTRNVIVDTDETSAELFDGKPELCDCPKCEADTARQLRDAGPPFNAGRNMPRSPVMRVPLSAKIAEVLALDEPSNRRGCTMREINRRMIEVCGSRMSLLLLWRDANDRADGSFDQPAWYARSAKAACARLYKAIEYLDRATTNERTARRLVPGETQPELVAPRGFWA